MGLSGRFIMGSLDNWFFGEDDTGDLLSRKNADKLISRSREVTISHVLIVVDFKLAGRGGHSPCDS